MLRAAAAKGSEYRKLGRLQAVAAGELQAAGRYVRVRCRGSEQLRPDQPAAPNTGAAPWSLEE